MKAIVAPTPPDDKGKGSSVLRVAASGPSAIVNIPQRMMMQSRVDDEGRVTVDPFAGQASMGLEALFGNDDDEWVDDDDI